MGVLKIGVLGAGIIGLTSAEQVKERLPTADITIIANKFGVDTTSDGAAGLFMPITYGFRGATEEITRKYFVDSYEYYLNCTKYNCGVSEVQGFVLSNTSREDCHCKVLSTILPIYRDATEEELLKFIGNWKYGSYVKTLITKGRNFLPVCLQRSLINEILKYGTLKRLKEVGIKTRIKTVYNLSELEDEFDIVINCTGIGAADLCGDYTLKPVRGQVFKARTPGQEKFILAGEDTYIIPYGYGVSTCGGTHQFSYYNTEISNHDTTGIIERCSKFNPTLNRTSILWEWAGLRPYRPTVRVEPEKIGKLKVVHNYGHGGSGITTAPGTSKRAAQLVENLQKMSKL